MAAGSYTVSGTDANGIGDTGTWSYTLTVTGVNIPQGPSTSGSVSTTNSNGFTDQLGPTTFNGAPVTFTTTVSVAGITVAPDGALSVTATLAAGSYTVSGTDANGIGDTGTWSYTLTVTGVNIPQGPSTSGSVSTTNSNGFTDQLGPTTFNGAPVTFTTTVSVAGITVAPDGALSVTATLARAATPSRAPTPTASVTPAPGATPSRSPASTFPRVPRPRAA